MDRLMYFGNRNHMQWVKCPEAGATYGSSGSGQSASYLNGGAFRRNTLSAAKTFNMSWSLTSRDSVRAVTDYAEGVYGPGPFFWGDPFTMDKNVLAQSFATPSLGGYDGVILDGSDKRPELLPTSANELDYPTQSARYVLSAASAQLKHWVPVPSGYTAWVGAHGDPASTGGIRVQPTVRSSSVGARVVVPVTSVTSPDRVTNSFVGGEQAGIELSIGGTTNNSVVTLAGVIVQVLKNGVQPEPGGFISGQGHSGCDWDERPSKNAYSAAMDLVGVSASFIETEQWR